MASRFYALMFVALTGIFGMVSPPDLALMTAQAQTTQDRKAEADRLLQQGIQQFSIGQFEAALQPLEQALTIYRAIKDRRGEGNALGNLGLSYIPLGYFGKAIDFQLQSLAIAREIKDRNGEGKALENLGLIYINLGKYDKVVDFQLQSLAIAREIKDRLGVEQSLENLGNAYLVLGKYDKAIEFYLQSLAIAREIKDRNGEGKALRNLGNAYLAFGKYDKAIDFQLQSLAIVREIKDRSGERDSFLRLGSIYIVLGKYDKAIDFHLQSLAIVREIKDRQGECVWLGVLGGTYMLLSEYDKAIESHLQSLAIARELKSLSLESTSLASLGFIFKQIKQSELAILFYKQSVNTTEYIRQDIKKISKEEQLSYRNTVIDGYRRLADLLLEKDRVMEALQVLDLLKVQDLQDFLKDVKGNDRTAIGVEMLPQEQKFLDEFNTIQDRAVKLGGELTELRKLQTLTPRQQQRLNEIEQIQQQVNQQLTAHLQSDSTKTLIAQLQQTAAKQNTNLNAYKDLSARVQRLGQGTALFYPLILDNRIELVLFIPNQPPIHRSVNIKQTELQAEIKTFRQQLEAQSPNIETTANELYKKLIAPIEPDLKAAKIQTIIYAPDGQMRYVPLAALHDGKQWLVERYLINNVTAVSLTNLDPNPNQQSQVLAGAFEKGKYSFTVNDKSYNFVGLPFAGKEVTDLAQTIPNTVKLVDNEFSRAKVLPNMKTSNIIHLATHAAFVEGSPDNSFILLGNGDRINLREVSEWDLPNVTLVVLSACQTALGGNLGNGIEILGFGYQLQRAKVRAAIASLWTVSDGGTQQLMSAFYTAIKTGKVSHAEALRQAQVALITGDYEALGEPRGEFVSVEPRLRAKPSSAPTKLTHPYYWAPFIMIGNGL
ncbi:MAG: CHAT domain-containing protein [Pseudanabaena sp. Salubria-1]|nr:CHAT domain-containing protein [Pseudanabaena sp. Salubria-1]